MSSVLRYQASLALNFVLAVLIVALAPHKSSRASVPSGIDASPGKPANAVSPKKVANEKPSFIEQPKLPQYGDIKSASDRRRMIIDQLRAMGVPNEVLGRVARVDFEAQWDSRFEKCRGDMDKTAAVQLEMNKSKDAEMRAALGEKDFKQWDRDYMLWEAMNTKVEVNPTEAEALYALKKKLQQRGFELEQARLDGTMDDAEIDEAYDKANGEFNQQMKAQLGDERYAKSQQLDEAFVADNFRYDLAKANPTDAQFQELFKLEKEWKKSLAELDSSSPDYQEKLEAMNEAREKEYQRVLGADAYNTLQKNQDYNYYLMNKYETLWGLDEPKIDFVYDKMQQYQKSVADYRSQVLALQARGQSVDWEAVKRNLQQSASQTQQALQNYLGQDSFNRLEANRIFQWVAIGSMPVKDGEGPPP